MRRAWEPGQMTSQARTSILLKIMFLHRWEDLS